ncbi:hypothetical protein BR93DRAFT_971923 [Coniochaeta sp. PMI_546]|nr:hypothetical protein BR93DRAFT_971923 [Coniochaeta sp. PMI_546]
MRQLLYSLILLPGCIASITTNRCIVNKCARAVTGFDAKPPFRIRRWDCSSFLATTVFALTSTVTDAVVEPPTTITDGTTTVTAPTSTDTVATVTVTTTTSVPVVVPRSRPRNAVPIYASDCNAAAYSSACLCWGVSAKTVIVGGATQTSTVTYQSTVTVEITTTQTPVTSVTSTVTETSTSSYCPYATMVDPLNCGQCGNVCPTASTCIQGKCVCDEPGQGDDVGSLRPQECCGGYVLDPCGSGVCIPAGSAPC